MTVGDAGGAGVIAEEECVASGGGVVVVAGRPESGKVWSGEEALDFYEAKGAPKAAGGDGPEGGFLCGASDVNGVLDARPGFGVLWEGDDVGLKAEEDNGFGRLTGWVE